jgi:hypothetical protein
VFKPFVYATALSSYKNGVRPSLDDHLASRG